MSGIFGILNDKNVTPSLLQGLQWLELEYGDIELVGVATLMEGRIQQRQTQGKWQKLQNILPKQPINKRSFWHCLHSQPPPQRTQYTPRSFMRYRACCDSL